MAARAALDVRPGEALCVDECDSLLSGGGIGTQTDGLPLVLAHARNLRIHVILVAKTSARVPAFLRDSADLLIYRPGRDPRYLEWLSGQGLPTEPGAPYSFWAVPVTGDPVEISVDTLSELPIE